MTTVTDELAARMAHVRVALERVPRVRLGHLPTRLDPCPRLEAALDGPEIWCKRDDCTGLAFGGNKTRQLEYVLGDALAQGADVLIQGAASQSNHSRQVAAAAARLGLECMLTPRRDATYRTHQGNQRIAELMATSIESVAEGDSVGAAKRAIAKRLRAQGRKPYIVGMGEMGALALASVAYVGALLEIVEELIAGGSALPTHFYATSQGSTQAGLQLGVELLGLDAKVIGINPMDDRDEAFNSLDAIRGFMRDAARVLGEEGFEPGEPTNLVDYVGPRYGEASDASREAIELAARTEGLLFDPVYSGKGLAGLVDHIRTGRVGRADRVVFVHTGGLPAIFGDAWGERAEGAEVT
jgi:L-cysteate sulfo-lyase